MPKPRRKIKFLTEPYIPEPINSPITEAEIDETDLVIPRVSDERASEDVEV